MNPDQKFFFFLHEWANRNGYNFIVDACDGNEASALIDGMAVDDVWGWLIPKGITKKASDEYYGCVEWRFQEGKLLLIWNAYEYN